MPKRRKSRKIKVQMRFIKKVLALRNSNNVFDLCTVLLLVTGRHTLELIAARFHLQGQASSDVSVQNVIRTNSDSGRCKKKELLSLLPRQQTFFLLCRLHSLINQQYPRGVTPQFRRDLIAHMKEKVGSRAHPALLRNIYLNYMFKFRNPGGKCKNEQLVDLYPLRSFREYVFTFTRDFIDRQSFQ